MAAPFSGEEIIKRSLFSSIFNLKFKTPKFQNWDDESTYYHTSNTFNYDKPCSSKDALAADAKLSTTDDLDYDLLLSQFQDEKTPIYSSQLDSHQSYNNNNNNNNNNVIITNSTYPVYEYHKNSNIYLNQSHSNDVNYSKTFDNSETIPLTNNQKQISLSDQLAGSLLLTSPISSEPNFFNEISYPKLSSPNDIYQEIVHECEPMLEKNALINENQQQKYVQQHNQFSQMKQHSLNKMTNFSNMNFIDCTMDLTNKGTINNFSLYQSSDFCQNNENSSFIIEKQLVLTDQQSFTTSTYPNETNLNEEIQPQIIDPNFVNNSKFCNKKQHFFEKNYFHTQKKFDNIENFNQNKLHKCCDNFQLNTCKTIQENDVILSQHLNQQFNNSSISNENELNNFSIKKDELVESAVKVIAAAVLDSDELSINRTLKSDKYNKKNLNQKLLSFFNSTSNLSLEEIIKLLVNAVKEAGGIYHQTNNNNKKTKVSNNKFIGSKKTPEEILQYKREQNNKAAARYRKRQKDAKFIVEDEIEALQQRNASIKLEIEIIDKQIKLLKNRFILTKIDEA